MDAFEKRLQFVEILKRLTSSQASIGKVTQFAIKNAARCGADLWDCFVEECEKAPLNAKINMFYALDGLLEASVNSGLTVYLNLLKRDLAKVVDLVTPISKEGILNLMATQQILKSWKMRRVLDPEIIEPIETDLQERPALVSAKKEDLPTKSSGFANFSRGDILRRIEDDRERHKRLREKLWILPVPQTIDAFFRPAVLPILTSRPSKASSQSPFSPASPAPHSNAQQTQDARVVPEQRPEKVDPILIEFEQMWENDTSGITDDDRLAMKAEDEKCFGPMIISQD